MSDPQARRFRAYCVGIPKTGTTSIAALFGRYRYGHEYMFQQSVEHIIAYHDGLLSRRSLREFVRLRDQRGGLEMDSASFNHLYLDILVSEFPDAKYILTVRDPYSWMNSLLNMLLRWRAQYSEAALDLPAWQRAYGRFLLGEFDPDVFVCVRAMETALTDLAERCFRFWGAAHRNILKLLPNEDSITVPTGELLGSVHDLARFAGVPRHSLQQRYAWSNQGTRKTNFLRLMDRKPVQRICTSLCGEAMGRFFPGLTLEAAIELEDTSRAARSGHPSLLSG